MIQYFFLLEKFQADKIYQTLQKSFSMKKCITFNLLPRIFVTIWTSTSTVWIFLTGQENLLNSQGNLAESRISVKVRKRVKKILTSQENLDKSKNSCKVKKFLPLSTCTSGVWILLTTRFSWLIKNFSTLQDFSDLSRKFRHQRCRSKYLKAKEVRVPFLEWYD